MYRCVLWLLSILIFLNVSFCFAADTETDLRIKNMEASLAESERHLQQLLKQQQLNQVELRRAKRELLLQQHIQPNSPLVKTTHSHPSLFELDYNRYPLSPYKNYFQYTSVDGANVLEFHGWLQTDQDIFLNAQGLLLNNGVYDMEVIRKNTVDRIWIRRARPTIEGTVNHFINFLINPDFGQGQTRIYDGFIDINYLRLFGLQVGYQMSLLSGIENYFDNFDYLSRAFTMEMSDTAMLAPDRQIGAVIHGSFGPSGHEPYYRGLSLLGFDDFFSYQFGIASGTPDNSQPGINPFTVRQANIESATLNNKVFEGRIFINPFIAQQHHLLQHLGFGFAASTEKANQEYELPDLTSIGQNPIFFYRGNVNANGQRTRIHPQAVWGFGPMGILADFSQTLQTLSVGEKSKTYDPPNLIQTNSANQIQVIYNLTQEDFNLFHLIPNRPFNLFQANAIGAWQLVLRYSALHLEPNVFNDYVDVDGNRFYSYADPRFSVQSSNSWSIGLNWFWNRYLRITTEYAESSFQGGCSTGAINAPVNPGCLTTNGLIYGLASSSQVIDRPAEKIFMQRFQLTF